MLSWKYLFRYGCINWCLEKLFIVSWLFGWGFFKRKYLNVFDDLLIHLKQLSLNHFFGWLSYLFGWCLWLLYFDHCLGFLFLLSLPLTLSFYHLSLRYTVSYSLYVVDESTIVILLLSALTQNFLHFLAWLHGLHNFIGLRLSTTLLLAFSCHRVLILISFFIDKEQLFL